mmetsp:Transcript_26247/g.43510  ORF Transcript_26247/g.43510 Transcript_26247/m.43510 type:complete len:89 (+) Transcript_26247:1064-1330(+)
MRRPLDFHNAPAKRFAADIADVMALIATTAIFADSLLPTLQASDVYIFLIAAAIAWGHEFAVFLAFEAKPAVLPRGSRTCLASINGYH